MKKMKGKPVEYNQAKTLVAVPLFRLRVEASKKHKESVKKFNPRGASFEHECLR